MGRATTIVAVLILAVVVTAARAQDDQPKQPAADKLDTPPAAAARPERELKTYKQKRSYQMGLLYGLRLRREAPPVDVQALLWGVFDAFAGKRLLTNAELANIQRKYETELKEHRATLLARLKTLVEDNLAAGKAFMAGNKEAEGVVTMANGLQYKVIQKGEGAFPKPSDTVVVRYRGWFIDGKEFASIGAETFNVKLDAPNTLKGWRQGVQRMQVGGTHRLFIPPELAFGSDVRLGRRIPPGATVIFEIELLDIVKPDQTEEEH